MCSSDLSIDRLNNLPLGLGGLRAIGTQANQAATGNSAWAGLSRLGTATLSFGPTPSNLGTLTVTGQTAIQSTSAVALWFQGTDSTADHNAYEHGFVGQFMSLSVDSITAGTGNDVVLGDSGALDYVGGDLRTIASTASGVGGSDTITGDDGDDIVIGGAAGDTIAGNLGNDLLLGDEGTITLQGGVLMAVVSTNAGTGGVDGITGDEGNDTIVGGAYGDTLQGGVGNDLILGDSGSIDYVGGGAVDGIVNQVLSTSESVGGDDVISGGEGADTIVGGAGNDSITAGTGNDVVLGDSGQVDYVGGDLRTIASTASGVGGSDNITSGDGDDIVIGGAAGDTIAGNVGNDLLLGDEEIGRAHV